MLLRGMDRKAGVQILIQITYEELPSLPRRIITLDSVLSILIKCQKQVSLILPSYLRSAFNKTSLNQKLVEAEWKISATNSALRPQA